jgi:predicted transposase/invertase (TIGR01784 family)
LQDLRSKNPIIEKAIEELEYLSQDEKTHQIYEEQLKAELDYNSGIYAAFRDGKLEGKLETQFETARKMRQKGFSVTEIQEITGLSETEIREHGIF